MVHAGSRNAHVAIVGAGLGGLATAIHLALAGYRVSVYEANDRPGGRANRISVDGFHFDTGPTLLNYPWVFDELFAAAGRNFRDELELLPVDPSVGFCWPDGRRLQLTSDMQALAAEFARFEPDAESKVTRFFEDAGAKYRIAFDKLVTRNSKSALHWLARLRPSEIARLSVWRSIYGELGRFFQSRYIKEALGAYSMYLGGSPYDLPGFFSILPYGELAYGLWLPKGGIFGLVEAMTKLAADLGVRIHLSSPVAQILTSNGAAKGLLLKDGREVIADAIVSNVDLPTTDTVLLNGAFSQGHRRRMQRTAMTPGVLTFYWGIRRKFDGGAHHTIYLPNDYKGAFRNLFKTGHIPRDLPFYVAMASKSEPSLAPEGCDTVFVLVPTPVLSKLGEMNWQQTIDELRMRVLQRLNAEGVDLIQDDITVERVLTPEAWSKRFGLYDGSAFGAAHNLFNVGPFRAPNRSRTIPRLYYVGASTTPGTGMPMVVLGGKMTAEQVIADVR